MTKDGLRSGDVAITQVGNGNIGQQYGGAISQQFKSSGGQPADPLDNLPDDTMSGFIRATAQSLTVLDLSGAALQKAQQTLDEIRIEAAERNPAHTKLRQLASALHRIVEAAAGQALGAVLLGLWHPGGS
jgi:hypothetical protein